jgi:Cu+-exporting ATPase
MHCAGCVGRVERAIAGVPGVAEAAVNLASGQAHVTFAGRAEAAPLVQAVEAIGFGIEAPSDQSPHDAEAASAKRAAMVAGLLALPVFVLEMGGHLVPAWHHLVMRTLGAGTSAWLQMGLTALILAWPGRVFFRLGMPALMRGAPEMNTLVALGTGAAFLYSALVVLAPGLVPEASRAIYFESAAIVVTFILIGRWLEARAKGQAGAAVRALLALRPDTAMVLKDGTPQERPVVNLKVGDLILARPGDRIAVDGAVTEGDSHVDEAMLTGEPAPAHKSPGALVTGGTVNGAGALTYRATAVGQGTYLASMARMVEAAQASKLPIQHILDRVTGVFVPAVMGVALLTFLAWLIFGGTLAQALAAAVTVLIIACPCAMGLAVPASIMVGTGRAAGLGVIFRKAEALQRLGAVQAVAFDKTGTLTEGRMTVTQAEDAVLRMAAALETRSEHPIAQAILAEAQARGLDLPEAQGFTAVPGAGVEAQIEGRTVKLGNAAFTGAAPPQGSDTAIFLSVDGALQGDIRLSDPVKPSAKEAIARLHALGLRTHMITGDATGPAEAVGAALGLGTVQAETRPEDKAAAVGKLAPVAFVGDGINDAPALAAADVGLGVGTGTDIAIETADVVLQSGDPMAAVRALQISRATMRNIRQNLAWAFGYNVALIPAAAGVLYPAFGVLLSPGLAGLAMALSSVAVVSNALRLRAVRL